MKEILSYWSVDITSVSIVALVCLFFGLIAKFKVRIGYFLSAIILMIICFFSPLHILSQHYLFSAHMSVHVLLLLCVAPLLLMSLPKSSEISFFIFLKQHPVACWLTGVGIMWFWHVPVVFNNSMDLMHMQQEFQPVHFIETISLIIAGMIFSAPVLHSNKKFRIDAMTGVVYLFTACIACSLLGLLITFAPINTYHHFLSMNDGLGFNKIIQQNGITQLNDQQAAGLIMWVPCCLIYVSGAMCLLMQWFRQKDEILVELK
jgi:cytochrome c oxidase assembly factor CtaG